MFVAVAGLDKRCGRWVQMMSRMTYKNSSNSPPTRGRPASNRSRSPWRSTFFLPSRAQRHGVWLAKCPAGALRRCGTSVSPSTTGIATMLMSRLRRYNGLHNLDDAEDEVRGRIVRELEAHQRGACRACVRLAYMLIYTFQKAYFNVYVNIYAPENGNRSSAVTSTNSLLRLTGCASLRAESTTTTVVLHASKRIGNGCPMQCTVDECTGLVLPSCAVRLRQRSSTAGETSSSAKSCATTAA
ncbi:hypothetical protein B0H11DRAFT_571078 [Mycena galericulata]|nr:hypothetical protein B0H11DRAFT_571078 [Mycena galericulata]